MSAKWPDPAYEERLRVHRVVEDFGHQLWYRMIDKEEGRPPKPEPDGGVFGEVLKLASDGDLAREMNRRRLIRWRATGVHQGYLCPEISNGPPPDQLILPKEVVADAVRLMPQCNEFLERAMVKVTYHAAEREVAQEIYREAAAARETAANVVTAEPDAHV